MASRRIEPEMIVAISAVVVGVCALGVSLFQASIMREQHNEMRVQRLAEVWPHVEFGPSITETFRFIAYNTGIGPARIETVRMSVSGETMANWSDLLAAVADSADVRYEQSQISTRVLPAGETLVVFGTESPALVDSLRAHVGEIETEICYCSVYDECWTLTFATPLGPQYETVEACLPTDGSFEQ